MALSLAQAQKLVSGASLAYTSNVTKNNLLLCVGYGGVVTSITDTRGSVWTKSPSTANHGGVGNTVQIWWAPAGGTGADTLTVVGATFTEAYLLEVQGFPGTPVIIDQKNAASGSSGTPTVGPLTTLFAPEALTSFTFYSTSATGGTAGWTSTVTPNTNLFQYIFEPATGSFTATTTPVDNGWAMAMATFGVAAAKGSALFYGSD